MKRKPARGRTHRERITGAELEARREGQELRRLRDQQRRVVALSRELLRAVKRADQARKALVIETCEGTDYVVLARTSLGEYYAGAPKLRDRLVDAALVLVRANQRLEDADKPIRGDLDYVTRVDAILADVAVARSTDDVSRELAAAGSSRG
jgi:hypothetical protein